MRILGWIGLTWMVLCLITDLIKIINSNRVSDRAAFLVNSILSGIFVYFFVMYLR